MDVLLLAMECNDAEASKYYRGDVSNIVLVPVDKKDEVCAVADESDCSSSSQTHAKDFQHSSFTRKSCHRCGNIRKNCRKCQNCPHIICKNCVLKMSAMYQQNAFNILTCPVCAFLCCCNNKSSQCVNKYHCYRKCPVSRSNRKRQPSKNFPRYCHYSSPGAVQRVVEIQQESGAASLAIDSDTDNSALEGVPQESEGTEECQDDPERDLEEMLYSFSPPRTQSSTSTSSASSIQPSPSKPSTMFSISGSSTVRDLKLPGFLSCGLLLGGDVHTARSSAYPTASFASRGALISCDDKMPGDPFFYSV